MEEIQNEQDMLNLDFIGENQDNLVPNKISKKNSKNIMNYGMNNNLNQGFDQDSNRNLNDVESTQEAFIQTLSLQIKQLQELLESKNKDFDNLNSENNHLKLLMIQEQKKMIDKDNILHSISAQKKNLEEKIDKYKTESENMHSTIKELNYKIIELNQNMISKENMSQFNNKIKDVLESKNKEINDDNNNNKGESKENTLIEKYEVELKKLYNIIDELEIKNNKLEFDNKVLNTKITNIISDKNNELSILKSIYQNQLNNLNKVISHLNNRIAQLFDDKNKPINYKQNSTLLKNEIMKKFNDLENKLNLYDKENCDLRKENQSLKSELSELKLVAESKEKIIQKLQTDFEMMENEYNNNVMTTQKFGETLKIDDMSKSEYINDLLNKQKTLIKENNDLKVGLKQMTKNINEANQLYFKKKEEYDKLFETKDNKLREYKTKITLLKMKVNELHNEISILKEIKVDPNNNAFHYSFFTQENKDLNYINNNTNKKDKKDKKLRCFTPKIKRKENPLEININMKNEHRTIDNEEKNDGNDIFRDNKIIDLPKQTVSIIKPNINLNNNDNNINNINIENNFVEKNLNENNKIDFNDHQKDINYLEEYKKTLKKIDQQINNFKL